MTAITLADEHWEGVDAGTEALLDKWLVREGDQVVAGQPVAQVVLVKTALEVVAPANGVIAQLLVPVEASFARGRALATLREA